MRARHHVHRWTVVALGIAVLSLAGLASYLRDRGSRDPLRLLVAASASERRFAARLTGGFPHARLTKTRGDRNRSPSPDLRLAVLEAERLARVAPSPANTALLGKALLLSGDQERAVAALEDAVRQAPGNAAARSDLAAAYLVGAESGRHADGARALDAALKASAMAPSLPEARFNIALAFAINHLNLEANEAWEAYTRIDPASPWTAEVGSLQRDTGQSRTWESLRALLLALPANASADAEAIDRFPHAVRELIEEDLLPAWAAADPNARPHGCVQLAHAYRLAEGLHVRGGDALPRNMVHSLASGATCPPATAAMRAGLRSYADGRRLMGRADFAAALPQFEKSAEHLGRVGSPMAHWARVHLAYLQYQLGDLQRSLINARRVEAAARASLHHALLARALFVAGLALRDQGRPDEALRLCAESIQHSEHVGETISARATARAAADIARAAGDDGESWRLMTRSLAAIEQEPSAVRRYLSYFNAALFARSAHLLEAALAFQHAAVRAAQGCAEQGALAQAFGQRAYLLFLLGRQREATEDLDRARRELQSFTSSPLAYYQAELDTIDAALRMSADAGSAKRLLERAAGVFARTAPEQVADAHVALARASLRLGDRDAAAQNLITGITFFEERRSRIADEDVRITFFGTARDLYRDLIQLLLARGDVTAAFHYSDRIRARALVEVSPYFDRRPPDSTPTPQEIRTAIGPNAAFVSYFVAGPDLVIWTVSNGELSVHKARLDESALERSLLKLRSPTASASEEEATASALFRELMAPVRAHIGSATVLYISADGPLHGVPFAQLLDRGSGTRLVEEMAIVTVPSASWLVDRRPAASTKTGGGRLPIDLLAIGNPAIARDIDNLPALPAAEQEAIQVARMYPSSQILRGAAATRREVLSRAPAARIIHFAGHAVHNGVSPNLSHLLLAPDASSGDGRLLASEIAALPLHRTELVILGACSTAKGLIRFGEGPLTLARPFLAAGARGVIASLWDVDDHATAGVLTGMHAALRQGHPPAQALRIAQLAMLRSQDPSHRQPRHWSAFVLIGGNAQLFNRPDSHPGDTHE